jgi:hypothetical protein
MVALERTGLASNSVELKKLEEFSSVLLKTVNSVKATNSNLRDSARQRYRFNTEIWESNLVSYRKLNLVDVTLFQRAYAQLANIRNDYDVVAKSTIEFQNALLEFFSAENEITWDELSYVLTIERHSYQLIVDYSKNLVNTLTDLAELNRDLEKQNGVL